MTKAMTTASKLLKTTRPSAAELFTPKLVTVLREGYGLAGLRADAFAGLTVAIVALPLSMAIAIASGVTPERGLFTAIVGGLLISALGGSRHQIGGPAGAFIVLVSATVARHGVDGLLLATLMAGVLLTALGALRIGGYVKFIPYPVVVGFTAGIGIIILSSQIGAFFGIHVEGGEPGPLLEKLAALAKAAPGFSPAATALAVGTVVVILGLRRLNPALPGMLIAVAGASLIAAALQLPVDTIATRFGEMPRSLPVPALPAFSGEKVLAVLPDAFAFALLGAIESLLSAVVADGMTGRRHRPNGELVAQGIANIGSALFGGIVATGTIARTATNVRAGAHGPVSGILHALFLLGFLAVAAPLAGYIPLAALAGVLAVVSLNMLEFHAIRSLVSSSRGDALVLAATLILVVWRDLTEGIVVGVALGALLFIARMAQSAGLEADETEEEAQAEEAEAAPDRDVTVVRISGPFFFGSAAAIGAAIERVAEQRKALVLDCSQAPVIDSTAAHVIADAVRKAKRAELRIFLTGTSEQARRLLFAQGVRPPAVRYKASIDNARAQILSDRQKAT